MRVTILGTAPGKSLLGKSHTAFLIEKADNKILLDCGEGTTQKILERKIARDELDLIIISHLHPDHIGGLFMLLQTLYLNKRKKDMQVYLPESIAEVKSFMTTLYMFNERFSYSINVHLYNENTFQEIGIYPFRNSHLTGYKGIVDKYQLKNALVSYSFIIRGKKKSLLLTVDIRSAEDISQHIKKCDVMIMDGIHTKYHPIKELLKASNIEVYITHGDYEYLQHKFAELLSDKIKLAKENDEIIL